MKKTLFTSSLLILAGIASAANIDITTANSGNIVLENGNYYTVQDGVSSIVHNRTAGARHFDGTIDLNGHTGIKLTVNNTVDLSGKDLGGLSEADYLIQNKLFFGFAGTTIKSSNSADTITIAPGEGQTSLGMNGKGLTVDCATVNISGVDRYDMKSKTSKTSNEVTTYTYTYHTPNQNVKNNGTLNWNGYSNAPGFNLNIGTEDSTTDTSSRFALNASTTAWLSGVVMNLYNGSFYFDAKGGRVDLSNSTIYAMSQDSFASTLGINKLTIGSGITNKILTSNLNVILLNNSELTVNSENIFASSVDGTARGLYLAGAASKTTLIFGADNEFSQLARGKAEAYALDVTLNNNAALTIISVDFTLATINFSEDSYGSFRFKLASKENNTIETALSKILFDSKEYDWDYTQADGYYVINVVPEPEEWACILGAMAIAFAFMRRKR